MRRLLFFALVFGSLAAPAQDWQTVRLDTFYVTESGEIAIEARGHIGMAYSAGKPEEYPHKYWIEGNIYFSGSPQETDAFYVFGSDAADSLELWTAGYSLVQKQIYLGKIDIAENGEIRLTELAKKPVEIIDHRNQNVYRIIFIYDTKEIKIEVNGVPLLTNCPVSTRAINHYGYLVKGKLVRFEKMRFNGE